jgi:SM-20-related protein
MTAACHRDGHTLCKLLVMTACPDQTAHATRTLLRPALTSYIVRNDFLPSATVDGLLEHTRTNQSRFRASRIGFGDNAGVNPSVRISSTLDDLGAFKSTLKNLLRPLSPVFAAELRLRPFHLKGIELELVAHGDGAFFERHIDTIRSAPSRETRSVRLLSGVYYFHATPKSFEGGALRLHEAMRRENEGQFVDVEPVHNRLVIFPSWMPHEVMPVRCPTRRFIDSRFAINCWFHRAR